MRSVRAFLFLCSACSSTVTGGGDLAGNGAGAGNAGGTAGRSGAVGGTGGAVQADGGAGTAGLGTGARGGGAGCGSGSVSPNKRVFVTSAVYSGNIAGLDASLSGVANADARCQKLAAEACLGGTWRAWLSDSLDSPVLRTDFLRSTDPYALVTGPVVATSFVGLSADALQAAINVDEHGQTVTGAFVWTGTNADGTANPTRCNDWKSDLPTDLGVVGSTDDRQSAWSNTGSPPSCDRTSHLYCFEQ